MSSENRKDEIQSDSATANAGSRADKEKTLRGSGSRMATDRAFRRACVIIAGISVVILTFLLGSIVLQGLPSQSLCSLEHRSPNRVRRAAAIAGTVWVCTIYALITLPIGIGTAVLIEEFRPKSRLGRRLLSLIQLNISNLAGVPSVVYGILGLTAFVSMFGLFGAAKNGEPAFEIGATYYDQFTNLASDPFLSMGIEDAEERYFLAPVAASSDPHRTQVGYDDVRVYRRNT